MKRAIVLLILVIAGAGAFLYSTNPNIRSDFDNWLGIAQVDSVREKPLLDSISSNDQPRKSAKRKKIPKTIRPDKFAHLDEYAKNTPETYSGSLDELSEHLSKPAKNDLEKARVIYSWIATHIRYDDEAFNSGNYKNEDAGSVLLRRTAVCEGFSSLFQELGVSMGLEVEKISGYAKGYGFQPGDKFPTTDHSWNAVKIDGTWQLVDVTWGSQSSETTERGLKTTLEFDPYWFCAQPEAFIFSHLPENKSWQLLTPTITLKQYEDLPFLEDSFFKMSFDAKEIFNKATNGDIEDFPETFPFDFPIKRVELPLAKKIERGREYTFLIESEYLENVEIVDGGRWIGFKKDGNVFKIEHTPVSDEIRISVKVNWFDDNYWTLVVYEITDEKPLAANNM